MHHNIMEFHCPVVKFLLVFDRPCANVATAMQEFRTPYRLALSYLEVFESKTIFIILIRV